jgi:hypothetical protein
MGRSEQDTERECEREWIDNRGYIQLPIVLRLSGGYGYGRLLFPFFYVTYLFSVLVGVTCYIHTSPFCNNNTKQYQPIMWQFERINTQQTPTLTLSPANPNDFFFYLWPMGIDRRLLAFRAQWLQNQPNNNNFNFNKNKTLNDKP